MSERASGDGIDPRPPASAPAEPVAGPPATPEPPYPGPGQPDPTPIAYPMTPYPVTATPYPVAAAPYPLAAVPYPYGFAPPPPRRGPWIVVLGITTGVLLLASGALGALWYVDRDRATRTNASQDAQITELREQVAQLEEELDETESQLRRAEDDLAAAQACPAAVQTFVELAMESAAADETGSPTPAVQRAAMEMIEACGVVP